MSNARKDVMCCHRKSTCDACLTDCERAEIVAKKEIVRLDLLEACRDFQTALIEGNKPVMVEIRSGRAPTARHARLMIALGKAKAAITKAAL